MKNQDEAGAPRLLIVDTSGPDFQGQPRSRRRRRRKHPKRAQPSTHEADQQFVDHDELPAGPQWPLEATSVQRAVIEYARRTAALGAQEGVPVLKMVIERLRSLDVPSQATNDIIEIAEAEHRRLRAMLDVVYEEG